MQSRQDEIQLGKQLEETIKETILKNDQLLEEKERLEAKYIEENIEEKNQQLQQLVSELEHQS